MRNILYNIKVGAGLILICVFLLVEGREEKFMWGFGIAAGIIALYVGGNWG